MIGHANILEDIRVYQGSIIRRLREELDRSKAQAEVYREQAQRSAQMRQEGVGLTWFGEHNTVRFGVAVDMMQFESVNRDREGVFSRGHIASMSQRLAMSFEHAISDEIFRRYGVRP